jgi:hypothetical protein
VNAPARAAASASALIRGAMASAGLYALLGTVAAATVIAATLGGGNPILALLPTALVAGLYLMATVPLRLSGAALLLASLALEDNVDIDLQWRSPLAILGDLLHQRIDTALGISGVAVTGTEVVLAFLFAVWVLRRTGSAERVDGSSRVKPASVIKPTLVIYLGGVLLAEAMGLARGLPLAPWKLRNLLHPVVLALFFLTAFRAEKDRLMVGRIVVFAAVSKAIQAVVVQRIAIAETGGLLAHATSHGDSVLGAVAMFILVADLAERSARKRLFWAALLLPVLIVGAVENNRRLLWVMLLLGLVTWYLVCPMKGWKRAVTRALVLALPVAALYVGVGWNRGGRIFAPVQTLRGVTDTSTDRSAFWREVENWNISMSLRERPILGLGLGGEYTEIMANDDVSVGFKEYREWPHNTVLGQLLLMGLFGFTAVWLLPSLTMFLAVRSHRMAATAEQRVAATACMATVIACQVLAWGDTGAHFPQYKIMMGLAVAVAARLAVATGAWPAPVRRYPERVRASALPPATTPAA